MKIFLILVIFVFGLFAQENCVQIKHDYFTASFDTTLYYPQIVSWWLTKEMIVCDYPFQRLSKFNPDPKLKKYTNLSRYYRRSGYDQGHNMPAADNKCNPKAMYECFYFSNITPQHPNLNRGEWMKLENYTRNIAERFDSVKVLCGSLGCLKKIGKITVPQFCWKIIYIKKLNQYEAYIFNNDETAFLQKSSLQEINRITNLNISLQ